jgi:hypothetical protein
MADQDDIRDRVIRVEEQIKVLKENDDKLEKKIDGMNDVLINVLEKLTKMQSSIDGAWKVMTIIGAVTVGLATVAKLFIK